MAEKFQQIAQALADRYVIKRQIGAGGMATVYLAEDLKHHREVAIKVLRPALAAVLGAERFLREIEVTAQLQHPHILPLFDSGTADGLLYYVMPYVAGESLREKSDREQQLGIDEAIRIAQQVASVLDYAHRHGVVHRDIKPENILLHEDQALIADFGVALAVERAGEERLTETGLSLGTPHYMSPEQAGGEDDIDGRSDIYALACVLFEMVGGRRPFEGKTTSSILRQHISAEPPDLRTLRSDLPEPVWDAVWKALRKSPSDRFGTAAEFSDALNANSVLANMQTPVPQNVKPNLRRAVTTLAAAIVAILVFGIFVTRSTTSTPEFVPHRIAVAPFENLTGVDSLEVLGVMTQEWITRGLRRVEQVDLVPSEDARQAVAFVRNNPDEQFASTLAAGIVVRGSYFLDGDNVGIAAEINDAPDQKVLHSVEPVFTSIDQVTDGIDEVMQRVAGFLAATIDERFAFAVEHVQNPPKYEAFRLFTEGLLESNVEKHYRAFELDTTFPAPLVHAAMLHRNRRRPDLADSLWNVLEPRLHELSPADRFHIRGIHAWILGDQELAFQIWQEAAQVVPGSYAPASSAYLALVTNRPRLAIEILSGMEQGPVRRTGSYYWSLLARARHMLGHHRRELRAVRHGKSILGDDSQAMLANEAKALAALGRVDDVREVLDEMESLPGAPGIGFQMLESAMELRRHGRRAAATEFFERTIAWYRSRPSRPNTMLQQRLFFRYALWEAEHWEEAYELARQTAQALPGTQGLIADLALLEVRLGNHSKAVETDRWLESLESQPYFRGEHIAYRAELAALLGQREKALQLLERALPHIEPFVIRLHAGVFLESLWDDPEYQRLMRPKG